LRDGGPLQLHDAKPPIVVVATEDWNRLTDQALSFALTVSTDIYAVHLKRVDGPDAEGQEQEFRERWRVDVEEPARAAGLPQPVLVILESQYRRLDVPLLGLVEEMQAEHPDRVVAVLLPELVKERWWQYLMHTHRARRVRSILLMSGVPNLVVMNIPWQLGQRRVADQLESELEAELEVAERETRELTAQMGSGATARTSSLRSRTVSEEQAATSPEYLATPRFRAQRQ
jgi:hypothetical protein